MNEANESREARDATNLCLPATPVVFQTLKVGPKFRWHEHSPRRGSLDLRLGRGGHRLWAAWLRSSSVVEVHI